MPGIVMIAYGERCYAQRYNDRTSRRGRIKELVKKHGLTNYTITIRPDDNEEDGQDIKHSRSVILRNDYCAPCVGL